ncbi:hypothetical protein WJX72_001592 [[Myrmecia] bisecta]|uniref:Class I SAM-dependent methyltransferase n=1 Tax=[Myrmecia] bisecta TaxID=41462 RepID=A0AAW1PSG9_9CHLO
MSTFVTMLCWLAALILAGAQKELLEQWTACEKFYLVDVWSPQEQYIDASNVDQHAQDDIYEEARANLAPWAEKTTFFRMYTTDAAKHIPDGSVDFIYVDARHDYCGVTEDLHNYWPKLRPGGIFAGHDYLTQPENALLKTVNDYSVCEDGTVNAGAVKGAVNDFAKLHNLQLVITYAEGWPTWYARKPCFRSH